MPFFIDNLRLDEYSTDPSSPNEGQAWYNVTDHRFKVYADGATHEVAHVDDLEAGSITVNATGFNGILSATDTDVQTALATIDQRIFTQATVPASTANGALWYNTASGWEMLMAYDSSRTKWLSVAEWTMQWGHDTADGELLRGYGVNTPATDTGLYIPRAACVKRISVRTRTDNNLKRLDVYVNGSSVLNFNLVDGTNSSYYKNNAVNLNLAEDDYVWIYVDAAGLAIADVAVSLWCAWRWA
jgi:hypothetical protein